MLTHTYPQKPLRKIKRDHMHSPGWQPTLCVTWCLIWWFEILEKYDHTWHRMFSLRPAVIKQHKLYNCTLIWLFSTCRWPADRCQYASMLTKTKVLFSLKKAKHMKRFKGGNTNFMGFECSVWKLQAYLWVFIIAGFSERMFWFFLQYLWNLWKDPISYRSLNKMPFKAFVRTINRFN